MRRYQKKNQLLIVCLAVGFFIGIIYENVMAGRMVLINELFLKSNLERYLLADVSTRELLHYVVQERLWVFAWICVFSCLRWKRLYVIGLLGILGFLMGVLTVASVLQLGMAGIGLCIVGMLPQGLFYGMVCYLLFVHWYHYPERQWNRVKSLFVLTMLAVGILVEVYVNPVCVTWILKMICK